MKTRTIPSGWLQQEGRRLDSGPYLSGGLEARLRLEGLSVPKVKLADVTLNIYHAGRESRTWVDSAEYGVPFLSSSSILNVDISNLPLLSNKIIENNKSLIIREGWTLITRSGTIGRMAYARKDMDGLACSEDVLRVVPDAQKILPGYLFAYLKSKFGSSIVTSKTYGAIIQHLEPQHIIDIPVPRIHSDTEKLVHQKIEAASNMRSTAAEYRHAVIDKVTKQLAWRHCPISKVFEISGSNGLQRRMDAFHHASGIQAARSCLSSYNGTRLGDFVEEVFEPNRGPRRKVEDSAYGIEFISSSEVFRLDPVGDYFISRTNTPNINRLIIKEIDLLLPRSGQIGGIIGRAVLPLPTYYEAAGSEHLVRVRCNSRDDAFYTWAILASEPGYYSVIGTAFGSSIPSLDCELLANLKLPVWSADKKSEIVHLVANMVNLLSRAILEERDGVALVERAIEEAT